MSQETGAAVTYRVVAAEDVALDRRMQPLLGVAEAEGPKAR